MEKKLEHEMETTIQGLELRGIPKNVLCTGAWGPY